MSKCLSVVLWLCVSMAATSCARRARIMSWKKYDRHLYSAPYVLDIPLQDGHLLYFGVRHTNDPADPQISEIERLWSKSRSNVAFNEGGDPPTAETRDEAVAKYGEAGLIRFLARRDGVRVSSIDPSRASETAELLKKFKPEQVKLFFLLRQVSEYGHANQAVRTLDDQVQITMSNLASVPGLDVAPTSIRELDTAYSIFFPNEGNYKDVPASWFDPRKSGTFLNEIAVQDNLYRDEYMASLLTREVRSGKRVFAVVGFSHVIRQESALRSALR